MLLGVVVFLFLVFYVQHFVLARFPLRLLLLCSVQYPPSRAAIGRWHIFSNPNWSRILNITHDICQVRVVLCGFFCFSIIKTRGGFVAAVSCQRAIFSIDFSFHVPARQLDHRLVLRPFVGASSSFSCRCRTIIPPSVCRSFWLAAACSDLR